MRISCGKSQNTGSIHTKTTNRKTVQRNPKRKKGFLKAFLKSLVLIGLLAVAMYFYRDSLSEILLGIRALSWWQIVVSNLLACGFFLLEGHIIYLVAHPYETSYQWKKGIRTAYLCEFYRILTLGNGSGFAAIYYLQRDGIPVASGTGITTLQFVIKKIGVMILGLIGFLCLLCREGTATVLKSYRSAMITGCIITMVIVVAMTAVTLSVKIKNLLMLLMDKEESRFPKQKDRLESCRENLLLLNATGRDMFQHKKRFLRVLVDNLAKLLVIYMIPAYILVGKCSLTFGESVLLMAVVYMLAGVIPAPSGIGSLEFVFLLFFEWFAEEGVTVPAILLFRFATWIVPFLIGALIFLIDKMSLRTNT